MGMCSAVGMASIIIPGIAGRGERISTWIKDTLQRQRYVARFKKKESHPQRRARSPLPGMMIHHDGCIHEWVSCKKEDPSVPMDDTTNEHYSMFFVQEEDTASRFQKVEDVILEKGRFRSIYTHRGSHDWFTPAEGAR